MWLPRLFAAFSLAGLAQERQFDETIRYHQLVARDAATALLVSDNIAVLHRTPVRPASSVALQSHIVFNGTTQLESIGGGAGYATTVSIGRKELLLSIDTGSSDTWIATTDLQCISQLGAKVPTRYCNFGPLYDGTFEEGPIPDQNFNVSYGSGEYVVGELGYSDLTIASLTIKHQEIAHVKKAFWFGDDKTTGLMGFGYRALTSSFRGSDASQDDNNENFIGYSPIVESAMNQSLFSMFSLALERGANDVWGYLALGGLPPIDFDHKFVSTPILLTNLSHFGRADNVYSFYSIRPDGFAISGGLLHRLGIRFWRPFVKTTSPVIIDSGTTLNYLPLSLANRINALFDPPAEYNSFVDAYEVDCEARTPDVAIRIAGVDLQINSQDMIIKTDGGYDGDTQRCITAVQAVSSGPYILGVAFLKSVVAVFDVGAAQMRFASRLYY